MVELRQKQNYSAYLVLGVASAIYLYRFVRVSRGLPDEGEFLAGAQRVLEGAIPSRDFVEPMGPGSFYLLAAFFRIFGTSFATAQMLLLATGVATIALLFYLARRIGSLGVFAAVFALATLIPQMPMNSSHHDSNLLVLLSFAVLLKAQQRGSSAIIFGAGLLAGLASCFIQQKGAYALAAYIVILVLQVKAPQRLRLCGAVVAGFALVVGSEFLLYAKAGALGDLIWSNFFWSVLHYNSANAAPYGFQLWMLWWPQWFSVLQPHFPLVVALAGILVMSVPYLLVMAMPVLLIIMGVLWRKAAFTSGLIPYWVVGYALLASEMHRRDLGHLINGAPILLILFFALCERSGAKLITQLSLAIMMCLAVDGAIGYASAGAMRVALNTRHGIVLASHSDAALDFLATHTKRGENVFVYPYAPRYYFMADVRNPTRYPALTYHPNTDEQFKEAVGDLESKQIRYVLWDTTLAGNNLRGIFPSYKQPVPDRLIMEPYLESHYRQIALANGFRVMERLP